MTSMSRRRGRSGTKDGRGLFERLMFSFMGPPQLGEDKAPAGFVPDDAARHCHKCHQQWEAHERVHTGSMTYRRCPTPV
jgi:hypothetical protein